MNQLERRLLLSVAALFVIGFTGHFIQPLTPDVVKSLVTSLGLHSNLGGNHFVDNRLWLGIPNAFDVLSNLPFAIFGIWGLLLQAKWRSASHRYVSRENFVLTLFFMGLLFTTVGSSLYHLAPSDAALLWDRAGIAFAFAGALGIAASERVSVQSGIWLGLASVLAGAISLIVWQQTSDILPWCVFQFGGIVFVLLLTLAKPIPNSLGVSLIWVVVFYALAKIFESTDATIFEATGQWVSGHTLKHLVASLAALPIIRVLK